MPVPKRVRHSLVAIVTFLGGMYFFWEFVTPKSLLPKTAFGYPFADVHTEISQAIILVGAMAIGLGIINLLRVHGGNIIRNRQGKLNSLALLIGLFSVFAIEIGDFVNSEQRTNELQRIEQLPVFLDRIVSDKEKSDLDPSSRLELLAQTLQDEAHKVEKLSDGDLNLLFAKAITQTSEFKEAIKNNAPYRKSAIELDGTLKAALAKARSASETAYNSSMPKQASAFVFNAFFVPLGSAMFSLLAFYVASAAYRTFRIRSLEAAIMMLTALIVMLGQIPHGPLYISEQLPSIRNWLLTNISTPAFRAIFFGSSIAGLAMAMRMWFSLERSPLASDDEDGFSSTGDK